LSKNKKTPRDLKLQLKTNLNYLSPHDLFNENIPKAKVVSPNPKGANQI
jgi:hypothetical protein